MSTGKYFARTELALRTMATTSARGRLQAAAPVTVEPLASGTGRTRTVPGRFELMGPGDVERVTTGAIVRRFPAPGIGDAEATKMPLIEFMSLDLPWRYTPQPPNGEILPPWLVLVVAAVDSGALTLRPDGTVSIGIPAQRDHPLHWSWRWAHVHEVGGEFKRSRIVSPVILTGLTQYLAVLVPAFTAAGAPSWTGDAQVTLPCYDSWQFRTAEAGDFPDLAAQLHRADPDELETRGGRPFGRAALTYRPRDGSTPAVLAAAGALRAPAGPGPDPADDPPPPAVAADVEALQTPITAPHGRTVITAPDYAKGFTADGADPGPDSWALQLARDPRLRGAAGLGSWTAIAWQNRIADAAGTKLGDTALAADRIRLLALGVTASRSLWKRRVPADPVQRLAVLAPSLGRLPADNGRMVLDTLPGHTPQLAAALLSSAGRRAIRQGPARSALADPAAGGLPELLSTAAECPDPTEEPDPGAIRADPERPVDPLEAAARAIHEATDDDELAGLAIERLLSGGNVNPAALRAVLTALQPGPDGRVDPDAVLRLLDTGDFPPLEEPNGWEESPDQYRPPCRPVDLPALGQAVADAIDPTVAVPPAARRVFATLPGITSMSPVEVDPELDIPLWSFLSANAPDWMLPGVGDLADHEVVALETNPEFVRALLVGANWQAASELRWRNIPLVPRCSPMRRFWQRPGGSLDILPIRTWPLDDALSSPALSPNGEGSEAVVVFKTPLFRRYPATVVYLYDARRPGTGQPDWTQPAPQIPMLPPARVDPAFSGSIGPDVTFFGFPVPASALKNHWVVLEEPPAGYRFYRDTKLEPPDNEDHAGNYAHNRFAPPVRVLLGPLL